MNKVANIDRFVESLSDEQIAFLGYAVAKEQVFVQLYNKLQAMGLQLEAQGKAEPAILKALVLWFDTIEEQDTN